MNNPHFDPERAALMIGKHVLIGLDIHDRNETYLESVQMHGDIVRVTPEEGVVVRLVPSGVEYAMPAVPAAFEEAPPGDYRLHSTGEVVSNPDLMTTWNVYEPEHWDDEAPSGNAQNRDARSDDARRAD